MQPCFNGSTPAEVEIAIAFLSGEPRQGRIGIGGSAIRQAKPLTSAPAPVLQLGEVDEMFDRIAATTGRGAPVERVRLFRGLLERATADEQDFLVRLLFGELRQGALEAVLAEAVARAANVSAEVIRRAVMIAGGLPPVARAALAGGELDLARLDLQLFQPVQPMLAQTASDITEALANLHEDVALEWKLDGARIQVHKAGDEIKVFSRNLREVTPAVPEVVEAVRRLPADQLILDGEVIALRADGAPETFQRTMQRFGRKLDVERLRSGDAADTVLFRLPLRQRRGPDRRPSGRSDSVRSPSWRLAAIVPRLLRPNAEEAARFVHDTLQRGHEGVMVKALASGYAAGRRGQHWLKVKLARTLDLVVLAAEWGHGRRTGWLSNLHLGARGAPGEGFVMLGKTFKGMTDEMLTWQTERLLQLEVSRDAYTVFVRPELVVEIAFNDVQASPHYPGGLALRFARVKRYRHDKTAADADTIDSVRDIYRRSTGREPPGDAPTDAPIDFS